MRKKLKLIATGSAALIWLIGLAGLPDDVRMWATEWLPMVADAPEKHVFVVLAASGTVALALVAYWWYRDAAQSRHGSRPEVKGAAENTTPLPPSNAALAESGETRT